MRRHLWVIVGVMGLISLLSPHSAGAQSLIANGGFEQTPSFTGWTVTNQSGQIAAVGDAQGGTVAARLTAGASSPPVLGANVSLVASTYYTLKWYAKTGAGATLEVALQYTDGTQHFLQDTGLNGLADGNDNWDGPANYSLDRVFHESGQTTWSVKSLTFKTPVYTGTYKVQFRSGGASGTQAYVDTASLIVAELTISQLQITQPTPTTALVTWRSNIPADSKVEYWVDRAAARAGVQYSAAFVKSHSMTVTGILPGVRYYDFTITSVDVVGHPPVSVLPPRREMARPYVVDDGVCARTLGENELVSANDCRAMAGTCENAIGAYSVASNAKLAHEVGVRTNIGYRSLQADPANARPADPAKLDTTELVNLTHTALGAGSIGMALAETLPAGERSIRVMPVRERLPFEPSLPPTPLQTPGSFYEFSIEWEEVRCLGWQPTPGRDPKFGVTFTDCERGANGTDDVDHNAPIILLQHREVQRRLTETANHARIGYYVQDDPPQLPIAAATSTTGRLGYAAYLRKLYVVIREFERVNLGTYHPVFLNLPGGQARLFVVGDQPPGAAALHVRDNSEPGGFDGVVLYSYPRTTNMLQYTTDVINGATGIFTASAWGAMPPFIGTYRAFNDADTVPSDEGELQYPNLTEDVVNDMVAKFIAANATAIAFYAVDRSEPQSTTIHDSEDPNNWNYEQATDLMGWVVQANADAVAELCAGQSIAIAPLHADSVSPRDTQGRVPPTFNLALTIDGTASDYRCHITAGGSTDNGVLRIDNAVDGSNSVPVTVPPTAHDRSVRVFARCWSGSLQDTTNEIVIQVKGSGT